MKNLCSPRVRVRYSAEYNIKMECPQFTRANYDQYENHKHKAKFRTPEEEWEQYTRHQVRVCSKCKEEKPLACFAYNTSGSDGFDKDGYRKRRPECTACTKKSSNAKNKTKAPPGTPCEICLKISKDMVFDHHHVSGAFRGWLCDPCNRGLGVFGDEVPGMIKALNYLLKKNPGTFVQVGEDGLLSVL